MCKWFQNENPLAEHNNYGPVFPVTEPNKDDIHK